MFKDAREELDRLQEQLLAEDLAQDEQTLPLPPQNVRSYNADNADMDLDELSEELLRHRSHSWTGVAVFMVVLTLAVLGIAVCVILRHLGVL